MNRKTLWWIIGGLVLAAIVVFTLTRPQEPAEQDEVVTIGAIVPLTGPAGDLGQLAQRGFKVAEALLPIRVLIQDSQSDPRGGVNAFQNLTAQQGGRIEAVVSFMSSVGNAVAPIAEDREIVNVHIASAPDLTQGREYAFRWYITSEAQMGRLVDYLEAEGLQNERIVFLYINDDYGQGSLAVFTAALREGGSRAELMSESYGADQTDFRSLAAQVRAFRPDVVAIVGYSSSLGILLRQLREQQVDATLVGDDAVSYPAVLAAAGDAAEGMVFPGLPLERARDVGEFYRRHREMYQEDPNDFAVFAFGATSMLYECMSVDDYQNTRNLVECLKTREFATPLGTIRFDSDHSGSVPLVFKRIVNGQPTALPDRLTQ